MADNDPISYLALQKGASMLSASGATFGTVEHVLQDSSLDLFDGIAVTTDDGLRFVDSTQIGTITANEVHTTLSDDAVAALPAPEGNAVLEADPDEYQENGLTSWFGRMFMREHWMRDRPE